MKGAHEEGELTGEYRGVAPTIGRERQAELDHESTTLE